MKPEKTLRGLRAPDFCSLGRYLFYVICVTTIFRARRLRSYNKILLLEDTIVGNSYNLNS